MANVNTHTYIYIHIPPVRKELADQLIGVFVNMSAHIKFFSNGEGSFSLLMTFCKKRVLSILSTKLWCSQCLFQIGEEAQKIEYVKKGIDYTSTAASKTAETFTKTGQAIAESDAFNQITKVCLYMCFIGVFFRQVWFKKQSIVYGDYNHGHDYFFEF